jgi:lysophospholipase L1-like esterase
MLDSICRGRSIPFLHVLQPTLHDPGSKVATAEEIEKGTLHPRWHEGVVLGYPMLRQAGAELAREGVPFLDLSMLFSDRTDTIYFDGCHFGQKGNELLARRIAAAILETYPDAR